MFNNFCCVNNRCKGRIKMHTFSWENEEIKTLFKFVEIKKQEGMPLVKIFEL